MAGPMVRVLTPKTGSFGPHGLSCIPEIKDQWVIDTHTIECSLPIADSDSLPGVIRATTHSSVSITEEPVVFGPGAELSQRIADHVDMLEGFSCRLTNGRVPRALRSRWWWRGRRGWSNDDR